VHERRRTSTIAAKLFFVGLDLPSRRASGLLEEKLVAMGATAWSIVSEPTRFIGSRPMKESREIVAGRADLGGDGFLDRGVVRP